MWLGLQLVTILPGQLLCLATGYWGHLIQTEHPYISNCQHGRWLGTPSSVLAWEWILKLIVLLELRPEHSSHQPSPALSFTIYRRRKYFVSALWLAAWSRSPGGHKTQLWKINGGVRMFQWAISLFITISPCPVSHGPDPNIVSGPWDSRHQSDMHIAHWTLWSSLVLTLWQYSEKETTCFMAKLAEIILIRSSLRR